MATIEERYAQKFAKSADWYQRGRSLFAGGITHQTRFSSPFPAYIEHAEGPFNVLVGVVGLASIPVLARYLGPIS